MNIRYSLQSIFDYLSVRSPKGAISVLTAIYGAVEFIRRNPEAAETTRIQGVRGKVVPRHRFKIFYRVPERDGVIEIIHIRHTSRRVWEGEDG